MDQAERLARVQCVCKHENCIHQRARELLDAAERLQEMIYTCTRNKCSKTGL